MRSSQFEIRKHLMSMLFSGNFNPAMRLPSVRDLAQSLGTGTKTVHMLMLELKREGIVETKGSKGTYLKPLSERAKESEVICVLSHYDAETRRSAMGVYPWNALGSFAERMAKYGMRIRYINVRDMDEKSVVAAIREARPAGLALLEINNLRLLMELKELRLPIVSMDHDSTYAGISSVVFSNLWGAYQATKHLICEGHRSISIVKLVRPRMIARSPFEDSVYQDRMEGYLLAMKDAGLKPHSVDSFPDAESAVSAMLGAKPRPTAAICVNNRMCAKIVEKLCEKGLKIPEDMDTVTFDPYKVLDCKKFKLTHLKVDSRGMGRKAAELLADQLKGEETAPKRVVIETELVVRKARTREQAR